MKIVFLGTPDFALKPLNRLNGKHEILAVITQPDKAGNRGKIAPPPVKTEAEKLGLPVFQYKNVNEGGTELIEKLKPDALVTAAYGQMLGDGILAASPLGTLNIHASLLPKYRGASPINSVLINGEKETGVTVMRTVKKMDAGDIVAAKKFALDSKINAGELSEKLSEMGAELIVSALDLIESGKAVFTPQDEAEATFCRKLKPELERINWSDSAEKIHNLVRGLCPSPSAWTALKGKRLKIYQTEISDNQAEIGVVYSCGSKGVAVGCGSGSLVIKTLQYEGGRIVSAADFVNGRKIAVGDRLE